MIVLEVVSLSETYYTAISDICCCVRVRDLSLKIDCETPAIEVYEAKSRPSDDTGKANLK